MAVPGSIPTQKQVDEQWEHFENLTEASRNVVRTLSNVIADFDIPPDVDTLAALRFIANECEIHIVNFAREHYDVERDAGFTM